MLFIVVVALLSGCRRDGDVFPNAPVVLICVDTLRADHLPAYGYRGVATPALGALAKDGVVFENAISQVPLTLPSHASLFTGLLPFQNGVRDNVGYRLAKERATIASFLAARGYATGGAVSAFVLDHSTGVATGFAFYEDRVEARESGQAIGEVQRPGVETERLLEHWIGGQPPGKPFFAFLHLYEPHAPYAPPEPFASSYAGRPYDGEIASADAVVGTLLAFLKAKDLYDKSLIVFLSDHGEGLGEHGEDEHGIFLYREAIRVPLLLKLPGSRFAGRRESRAAALVDVFPTIAAALGMEAPAGLSGTSLLAGGGAAGSRIYSETQYPRFHFGWSDLASLADGRYHYIHGPRPEFYDWSADPAEKTDLARDLPATFRAMRVALSGMSRPLEPPGVSDPETLKKLAALGYISVTQAGAGDTGLPDPRDRIATLGRLKEASRLSGQGRFDHAVLLLEELVRESPRMLDAREALARALRQAGRPAEAFDALSAADRLQPGTPQILLGLADIAREKGDPAGARSFARAAEAVGAAGASRLLAEVALGERNYGEARRLARAELSTDEGSRGAWLLLANIERESGDLPAAWKALEHLRQLDVGQGRPPVKDSRFLEGDVLARMGKITEAEAAFREEIRAFPENPRGWTGLALLLASEGKASGADRVLREMLVKSPRLDSYFAAARTYEVLGDRQAARRVRTAARGLFPGAREPAPSADR